MLERKDLNADDKIEAMARRGFAQFQLKDLDTAERTFSSALYYFRSIEKEERLQTDFYLGLSQYHLGQIPHERFRAVPLRLPEKQMAIDMDDKARLLLSAQRQYIETIKLGNPQWASASGYQVGSLYEELYDAFIHAPIPPELLGEANQEKREVYYDELRKKIRILLEKSLRTARAEPADDGAPGRPERVARQVQAGLRQAAADARPELQVDFADPARAGQPAPRRRPPGARPRRRAARAARARRAPPDADPKPTAGADRPRAPDSVAPSRRASSARQKL